MSGLGSAALARTSDRVEQQHAHLHIVGDFDRNLGIFLLHDFGDPADDPAGGDHGVAAADIVDHFPQLLDPLLLRPDEKEVEDRKHRNERHDAGKK